MYTSLTHQLILDDEQIIANLQIPKIQGDIINIMLRYLHQLLLKMSACLLVMGR